MISQPPRYSLLISFFFILVFPSQGNAQPVNIQNDTVRKIISIGNEKLKLLLHYHKQANIAQLNVNGQTVISGKAGVYSSIRSALAAYTTLDLFKDPIIKVDGNRIQLSGIFYGDQAVSINETWTFLVTETDIQFTIERNLSKPVLAEQAGLPCFRFDSINTWDGAYQDYGGLAWFYLFNKKLDTYGVHSASSQFWNSKTNNGLSISVLAPGENVGMDYSRTSEDQLAYSIALNQRDLQSRFDSGTNRRRFIRDRSDVWAPITIPAGTTVETITLSSFDFKEIYGRGDMPGINAEEVNAVLNTIARIGVIDRQHFGGNSWHTPYGPICLHEQYIAQMGLGINDSNYLKGYAQCLSYYRDHAIKATGRVWPRWAYSNEDAMPGAFTDQGFYEAQWGYLLDANPDFVTNCAELYDQTGDKAWIKTQQAACEKALDWIMARDSNHNGLVEMMTDNHSEKKGSDWIDIIWASYENAFVNAKLYHALVLWADIERQLNNPSKQRFYAAFAEKLKTSFNKAVSAGGFWDEEKKCYIHWRDKDGSIHGNNMVTPVNFMAIAYGICDDPSRKKIILDTIESQMQKEQLFFWPLCLYSYNPGEGNDWQFPFPNYENGDIFLSWGSVAVKAYAEYKPELALKYVKNVLAQYAKDGLAYQRYGRAKQDGLGDDILSGNSLSVVGLYQAIYGINPRYNRFYLDPHITPELAGTRLRYNYRGQKLSIALDIDHYSISNDHFSIGSRAKFGFFATGHALHYFFEDSSHPSLVLNTASKTPIAINIKDWSPATRSWSQQSDEVSGKAIIYLVNNLQANSDYQVQINKKRYQPVKTNANGQLRFDWKTGKGIDDIVIFKLEK